MEKLVTKILLKLLIQTLVGSEIIISRAGDNLENNLTIGWFISTAPPRTEQYK
jgi:hypothetical protein